MNRHDFIEELKRRLRKLPYDEIKEAVDYYEEYFDDAGIENEQSAIAELGSPSEIASQIIAGYAVKGSKSSWRSAWLVILALLASPVAVPVALAVGAVALALVISASAVVFSFFAAGVAVFVGGLACIAAGIQIIVLHIPTTLFMIGAGLVLIGAGTALFIATLALSRVCFGGLAKLVGRFILGRKTT